MDIQLMLKAFMVAKKAVVPPEKMIDMLFELID